MSQLQQGIPGFPSPQLGDPNAWVVRVLLKLFESQQEQQKKQDDIAARHVVLLESANARKVSQNCAMVALTEVQRSLIRLMLMREAD